MAGIIDQIKGLQNQNDSKEMQNHLSNFKMKIATALYLVNPKDNEYKIKVVNTDFDYESHKYKVDLKFENGFVTTFLSNLIYGYDFFSKWSQDAVKSHLKNIVITDNVYSLHFEIGKHFDECSLIFSSKNPLKSNEDLLNFFIDSAKETVKKKSENKYSIVDLNPEMFEYDICQYAN